MKARYAVVLLALLATGCAVGAQVRLEKFDATARAYARAIRWSDFQTAYGIAKRPIDTPLPDFNRLKNVRVTSYDAVSTIPGADGTTMRQLVEIGYVYTDRMSARQLVDQQEWYYVEADGRWYLRSAFPEFR
jgi:hypothetical protein